MVATESSGPLKPIQLLVLTMLAEGDRHGYGIRQDILEYSDGEIEVEAGNLYRHIRGLEDAGLLTDVPSPRSETDDRRIYYRLTPRGRKALAAELLRLRSLVRLAEQRGIIAPLPVASRP